MIKQHRKILEKLLLAKEMIRQPVFIRLSLLYRTL